MIRILNLLLCFIFYLFYFTSISVSEIVKEVGISGNDRISDETILMFSEVKIGDDLENDDILLSHLGMSGKWTLDASECEGKHDHVVIHLDDGSMSVYNDPRRFGVLDIFTGTSHKLLDHLGPEPLENWTAEDLYEKLQRRKSPIKICILDQKVVVGVGNIYACEALNRSHISPTRKSNKVTKKECQVLVNEIKVILAEAIQAGGSTLRDFAGVDGTLGYFPHQFRVYDKEGSECECGGTIERLVQGGRSTFWCPSCQK